MSNLAVVYLRVLFQRVPFLGTSNSSRAMISAIVFQNSFVLVFCYIWGIAYVLRDTLQYGVPHRCDCVKLSATKVLHHLGECEPP